jgi:hypothetical protein
MARATDSEMSAVHLARAQGRVGGGGTRKAKGQSTKVISKTALKRLVAWGLYPHSVPPKLQGTARVFKGLRFQEEKSQTGSEGQG